MSFSKEVAKDRHLEVRKIKNEGCFSCLKEEEELIEIVVSYPDGAFGHHYCYECMRTIAREATKITRVPRSQKEN